MCDSMLPALRSVRSAAAALVQADQPEAARKAAAQVLVYTPEVQRLCGPTPR